jgi:hypothetical protein
MCLKPEQLESWGIRSVSINRPQWEKMASLRRKLLLAHAEGLCPFSQCKCTDRTPLAHTPLCNLEKSVPSGWTQLCKKAGAGFQLPGPINLVAVSEEDFLLGWTLFFPKLPPSQFKDWRKAQRPSNRLMTCQLMKMLTLSMGLWLHVACGHRTLSHFCGRQYGLKGRQRF